MPDMIPHLPVKWGGNAGTRDAHGRGPGARARGAGDGDPMCPVGNGSCCDTAMTYLGGPWAYGTGVDGDYSVSSGPAPDTNGPCPNPPSMEREIHDRQRL